MKTINQEIAERIGRDFAKERRLSLDDPIVKDLIRGCKMSLGAANYRNRLKAERLKDQMAAFEVAGEKR